MYYLNFFYEFSQKYPPPEEFVDTQFHATEQLSQWKPSQIKSDFR